MPPHVPHQKRPRILPILLLPQPSTPEEQAEENIHDIIITNVASLAQLLDKNSFASSLSSAVTNITSLANAVGSTQYANQSFIKDHLIRILATKALDTNNTVLFIRVVENTTPEHKQELIPKCIKKEQLNAFASLLASLPKKDQGDAMNKAMATPPNKPMVIKTLISMAKFCEIEYQPSLVENVLDKNPTFSDLIDNFKKGKDYDATLAELINPRRTLIPLSATPPL